MSTPGSAFTETEARVNFIDDFLIALGWDVRNEDGKPQMLMDVVMERQGTTTDSVWGRPDYRLRVAGNERMPVEAKRPSVNLRTAHDGAIQSRTYGWSLSLPASVLTNFAETVIYDSTIDPKPGDSADVAVIPGCRFTFDDYVPRFDELWKRLSYEAVSTERFNQTYSYTAPPRGESPFDRTFLAEFRRWRLMLAQDIANLNAELRAPEVGRRVQKVLNALLFLRVCEDRNISRYKELWQSAVAHDVIRHFRQSDKLFNAGIFRALEGIRVSNSVLMKVIEEMYWPRTQFAFSVLRPDILAGLYEQYLAEQVAIDKYRAVSLESKPEVVRAGGIAHTPGDIVNELNMSALRPYVKGGVAPTFRLLDPAVGSGAFLLDAFNKLVTAAETAGNTVGFNERAELVKTHLFGIDIDGAAVEVTRLSLLLAIIGEDSFDSTQANNLLPDLGHNVIAGNSVVREDFDRLVPEAASVPFRRASVLPTNLAKAFGDKYPARGFDAIVGNPPYVRIQILSAFMPDQLTYLRNPSSGYSAPSAHSFDLSLVFMERALTLLAPTGRLAMIVPHRFTNHLSGSGVRGRLGERLERLVHFGEEQVFPGKSTYCCLVIAGPKTKEPADFELVSELAAWRVTRAAKTVNIARDDLTSAAWPIATERQADLFEQLSKHSIARLGDPDWVQIFVGVQTSLDELYFINPAPMKDGDTVASFTDFQGVTRTIERSILRAAIKDRSIDTYDGQPEPDRWVIFPYRIQHGASGKIRATVFDKETMSKTYPLAFEYFETHRAALTRRSVSPDPGEAYWAYGRSQSLTQLDDPKLIVRVLSLAPRYALDTQGLVVPGGGDGGPYYLLRPKPTCPYPINVIQAILSHPAVDLFVTVNGKKYRGSYAVHRKAFLAEVPIPRIGSAEVANIADWVDQAQKLSCRLRHESDSVIRTSLNARREFLEGEIEKTLTIAYQLDPELVRRET
ncbi:DNA methyltransferase [Rhodococcus sp. HNM0569]|uniref:Eco57I restriction-modification methylase domain-containing protein n=1 Tax=Rhodococcus sp. HNM0569 TaxID=2716340 RepID=UPI00146F150C|nr:DNA methyltransferase [Rhodococcus sp. HNM0569]NLU84713.1 N-6 DNA methylase [Rhodococcus sp. HNM0569]